MFNTQKTIQIITGKAPGEAADDFLELLCKAHFKEPGRAEGRGGGEWGGHRVLLVGGVLSGTPWFFPR